MLVKTQYVTFDDVFYLVSGKSIPSLTIAYEVYGKLNSKGDNVILICHALAGDAHAAGYHADAQKPGWWNNMIGPNLAFDTNRYFIICSNVLGSCYGTTGPTSINPATNRSYGRSFPLVTIQDMVNAQKKLLDYLEIHHLYSVAGGSLGGMQALQWAISYPEMINSVIAIATGGKTTPLSIAFNTIARYAIINDVHYDQGDYYDQANPRNGLAIARMVGYLTYLGDQAFNKKFGRKKYMPYAEEESECEVIFEVENYLRYNGYKFTERFDANTYLTLLRAMDLFDLSEGYYSLEKALERIKASTLFVTFSSDFLFPEYLTEELVVILKKQRKISHWVSIQSENGHDAFLLKCKEQENAIRAFLNREPIVLSLTQ